MTECHFCARPLPEEDVSHVIYAEGRLHKKDPELPLYPVCHACLRYHKLTIKKLIGRKP